MERYLTKPISKAKIISAVEEAIEKVDKKRNQRSNLLKIQEKLETVIPVVENSFVGSLLFQQEEQTADYSGSFWISRKNRAMSWSSSLASRMKMVG